MLSSRRLFLIIIGVLVFILVGGFILWKIPRHPDEVVLEFWSVFDDSDQYAPLISKFRETHPWIKIKYKKFPYEEYERSLLEAWASGQGPDIFSIHNTWLPKHKDHIYPFPQDKDTITIEDYKKAFMPVVVSDFVRDDQIYALPLSIDTLALYSNKGMLEKIYYDNPDEAWILSPPETWQEFIDTVKYVTKKDVWGNIERAGATLGTANNVKRASDILCLIMLQSGTKMVSDNLEKATFDRTVTIDGRAYNPGERALEFYTDFANPRKKVYTWNVKRDYSVDDFSEGDVVMTIGYSYLINTIERKNPNLRFKISPVLQLKESKTDLNYANYWGQTVSRLAKHPKEAWEFLYFAASPENVSLYLNNTNRPTARLDMLTWQEKTKPRLGIFARQAVSAKSWYQVEADAVEQILLEMIEKVNLGKASVSKAITEAAQQLTLLMNPPKPPSQIEEPPLGDPFQFF